MKLVRQSHKIPLNELAILLCNACIEKLTTISFDKAKGIEFVECDNCDRKIKESYGNYDESTYLSRGCSDGL